MAIGTKLSQIALSASNPAVGDTLVGVTASNNDVRFSATQAVRIRLTGNTSYFVSSSGSDLNGGTNSTTDAWLTLQHAANFLAANIDGGGFNVTVNIGSGSFAGVGIKTCVGISNLFWLGAGSALTTVTAGPNDGLFNFGECFSIAVAVNTVCWFNGLTLQPAANAFFGQTGLAIYAEGQNGQFGLIGTSTDIIFDCIHSPFDFIDVEAAAMAGIQPGTVKILGQSGTVQQLFNIFGDGASLFLNPGVAISVTGNLTVVNATAIIETGSIFIGGSVPSLPTFTGAGVTGQRFQIVDCGSLSNNTGASVGINFFPGNVAGTIDPSSSYEGFQGHVSGSGLPTTTQFPNAGTGGLYKDTSGGGVYMTYNDSGTIKKVALT